MNNFIKLLANKAKFSLGYNPSILKNANSIHFIPNNYKSVVAITADFELAWAPRYDNSQKDSFNYALIKSRVERRNLPLLLELFDKYKMPITWATVGHLFLNSCSGHAMHPKVNPYKGPFWDFTSNNWFEYDPCSNYLDAPEWYAPDLIQQILSSKVKHEIGCHTFSHIDCRDEVCSPELFEAELIECKQEASKLNLSLKSFVHPGHTIGNLDKLAELGFTSFQSDPGNILGYPVKHKNGLWELKRTYEFAWRDEWSAKYHKYRYKAIVDRAIKSNTVCNFWFHPSFDSRFLYEVLPYLLEYINKKRDVIYISTVGDYIDWLNEQQ